MLQALILLVVEESEKSKAPFYIAGGVLAGLAFAVSAVAIRDGGFAADKSTSRVVMALFALLVVAAMAMAVAVS